MSMMAEVTGVEITDLDCFVRVCGDHGIEMVPENEKRSYALTVGGKPVAHIIRDKTGYGIGYLVKTKKGYGIHVDNDTNYSSLTQRLGKDCGLLIRDYAAARIKKSMGRTGMLRSSKAQADGSLILRFAVNG